MFDGTGDDGKELASVKGLEQVVHCAAAEGVGGNVNVMGGRDHNNWSARAVDADTVEQAEAVDFGNHDVGKDEVVRGVFLKAVQGLFATITRIGLVSAAFKENANDATNGGFIIDYKNAFCGIANHPSAAAQPGLYRRETVWLEMFFSNYSLRRLDSFSAWPSLP
jgi:hypothetical protein